MKKKKPNIILIIIDSLRADHLGFMGYEKNISPNIDALAKESVVFTNAFSNGPVTLHSFPSILTSTYPLDYQGPRKIERPRVLISEVLQKAGYITAIFHSNPYLSTYFGYNKGWDFSEDLSLLGEINTTNFKRSISNLIKKISFSFYPSLFFWVKYLEYKKKGIKNGHSGPEIWGNRITANLLNQVVKDFIVTILKRKKPFFICIHYMDVHSPYFPANFYLENKPLSYSELVASGLTGWFAAYPQKKIFKNFVKNHIEKCENLYGQSIYYMDKQIGNLIGFLKEKNIYEDSLIFLTADHGDEFLEHEGGGHSAKLYNELLHVPLIVKIPRFKSKKIKAKVTLLDLSPTICAFLGIKSPPSFKGKNLFQGGNTPIFHQTGHKKTKDGKNITFAEVDHINQCKMACQFQGWKYIINYDTKTEELYDLKEDPKEQKNLSNIRLKELNNLRYIIREFEKKNPPLSLVNK